MGTFGGHVLPGSFFVVFSFWHMLNVTVSYFRSQRFGQTFRSSTYFPLPCGKTLPMECILKLAALTIGIVGEVITGFKQGYFANLGNGQHICMFSAFGIATIFELLSFCRFYLPDGLIYMCYVFAFSIEALLFYWHLHIQQPLEVQVHTLLLYVIFATIASLLMEMRFRGNFLPAFCRTYFILLQGFWFIQMAFILYPPSGWRKWEWDNHDHMMIVTIVFCINWAVSLAAAMVIWFAVACRYGLHRRLKETLHNGCPSKMDHQNGSSIVASRKHPVCEEETLLIEE